MRSQSVRESFKVDFLLIFSCLSHGNDTDVISFFGMGDHSNYAFEKTKGDEAFFSVVETIIFKVNVTPSKISFASIKSKPWFRMLILRFFSSHVNFMLLLYV